MALVRCKVEGCNIVHRHGLEHKIMDWVCAMHSSPTPPAPPEKSLRRRLLDIQSQSDPCIAVIGYHYFCKEQQALLREARDNLVADEVILRRHTDFQESAKGVAEFISRLNTALGETE